MSMIEQLEEQLRRNTEAREQILRELHIERSKLPTHTIDTWPRWMRALKYSVLPEYE